MLTTTQSAGQKQSLHLLPEPVSATMQEGYFLLKPDTRIVVSGADVFGVASLLAQMLNAPTGYHLTVKQSAEKHAMNAIVLRINPVPDATLGEEGYTLQVLPRQVMIGANKPQGLFYGIQTLMQLLPPTIGNHTVIKDTPWKMPCVNITDYPRFAWRGLMLDVSRHFFSKAFIKQYIDEMSKYKLNVFHWHLTDDQGWRIEIKGLPELTKVGAWRVPRTGAWRSYGPPEPGEKATDGGYYTQEDIREVVAYAQQRFVTIVPEIDVPAHSLALIASYPGLSCTKQQYAVNPGSKPQGEANVLCVANDSTWLILDKIFTQVADLFPGAFIHTGGDEANKKYWMNDQEDLALMKREGLNTPEQLQSYFEKRLAKLIHAKGKKMIGWDEIMEGGLAPGTVVMCWRGINKGIQAARMGHQVIMTPIWDTYLSRQQGDPFVEPVAPGNLRLHTCYQFDPVPDSVEPKNIIGGQGSLWTEFVANGRHAEYMTWPRAMALAEVLWSPKPKRNWPDFIRRVEQQFKYMDAAQVKYARSMYDPIIDVARGRDDSLQVTLASEIPGVDVYYTFDGTNPDNFYPRYTGTPLDIPKGASEIRVITYRGQQPVGQQINCPLSLLKQKLDKKIKREMQQKSKQQ
ncbi:family 20 glycosylhydrolase [Chitinophaga sp. MM2321]|uniref:beta-N-acetylhexosaminidase n=1 Tax=Chitinophaga sp. MM2321 TaxID=3137178 RepID=UPI0032D5884A